MVVNIFASAQGSSEVILGNIVGSTILPLLFILSITGR